MTLPFWKTKRLGEMTRAGFGKLNEDDRFAFLRIRLMLLTNYANGV